MSLRIALDARLETGRSGGVETVVLGLARSLAPGGRRRGVPLPDVRRSRRLDPSPSGRPVSSAARAMAASQGGRRRSCSCADRKGARSPGRVAEPAGSPVDEAVSAKDVGRGRGTSRRGPVRFHDPVSVPHRHSEHLSPARSPAPPPSRYFSPREIATRELNYRTYCDRAQMVAVTSRWAREDLIRQYGLPGGKVVIVPGRRLPTSTRCRSRLS